MSGTIVSLAAPLRGVTSEGVEKTWVVPLENAVSALQGVAGVRSRSMDEGGYLEVYFDTKEDARHLESVRGAVNSARRAWPHTAEPIEIATRQAPMLK